MNIDYKNKEKLSDHLKECDKFFNILSETFKLNYPNGLDIIMIIRVFSNILFATVCDDTINKKETIRLLKDLFQKVIEIEEENEKNIKDNERK